MPASASGPPCLPCLWSTTPVSAFQFQFLSFLFATKPGKVYKGRDLTSVHIELTNKFGFSDAHFDLAKVMLREGLTEMEATPEITEEVLEMIEKTRFLLLPNSVYKPKEKGSTVMTVLDALGGPDALKAVINDFYDQLETHEKTKHFFVGFNMQDQRERQVGEDRGV